MSLRKIAGRIRETAAVLLIVSLIISAVPLPAQAETLVTLSPGASPSTGQPGVHTINLTGSGFPAGTISPGSVNVKLQPASPGGGATVTTTASAVTTVLGSTRRVTFTIPGSLVFTAPVPYLVSLSGTTTTGIIFSSSNKSSLTINPPPKIVSVDPPGIEPGKTVSISIATQYTNFTQGATMASFGPGISVGGAPEGTFGPVTVSSPTSATAVLASSVSASQGFRSVIIKTGVQQASLENTFSVTVKGPPVPVPLGRQEGAEGVVMSFQVSADDPDGDPLTYGAGNMPNGSFFDPVTRTFSWTPGYDQAGTYHVLFSVNDGTYTTEQDVEIVIANTNRPPVITTSSIPATAKIDETYQVTIMAKDDDMDTLTFSLTQAPSGMSIDPSAGVITWKPLLSHLGDHTITVQVDDGSGGRDTRQYAVTVYDTTSRGPAFLS